MRNYLVLYACGIVHTISRFSQEECTFSNIPTCEDLPVEGNYIVLLALTFRYRVALQGHLLFVDQFNKNLTFPLMYQLEISFFFLHVLILHFVSRVETRITEKSMCHRRIKIRHKYFIWLDYCGYSSYQKSKCWL